MPITHDSSITKGRVMLLACILEGRTIDVGQLIHKEIVQCTSNKTSHLFFLILTTRLCLHQDVPVLNDEEIVKDKLMIDKHTMERLMLQDPTRCGALPTMALNKITAQFTKIQKQLTRMEEAQSAFANQAKKREIGILAAF